MNVLLIGGVSSFMRLLIDKLNKEGHRIFVLTGEHKKGQRYKKVFEIYRFSYDNECIGEVFDSIKPDIVVFAGAYDVDYKWKNSRKTSISYISGLMNLLMAYLATGKKRFIYLSSDEVFQKGDTIAVSEEEPFSAYSSKGLAVAMGEELCQNYRRMSGKDIVVLRLDHMYGIPKTKKESSHLGARMCIEALRTGEVKGDSGETVTLLYEADAVEFIYKIIAADKHERYLYHISSMQPVNTLEIAEMIVKSAGKKMAVAEGQFQEPQRVSLLANTFDEEFGIHIFHKYETVIPEMAEYMLGHPARFLTEDYRQEGFWKNALQISKGLLQAAIPFIENMICFVPFFMLNNRAVGSEYFGNLDFYLLYVLLFAIIYGQQQATFSSLLAVAGYCFRQMYQRSGFEVMLDYNTYVWIAQLLILGLVVGYMRDQIRAVKEEEVHEIDYLSRQLDNISDINISNVRVKEMLSDQVVNQNDSFGKIYEITSSLDKYESEEVLFYAAEVLSGLMNSGDVAIYTVANRSYARLFSATSGKARSLGNSINYPEMEAMYTKLAEKKVYINKNMDEAYPLMANAIYAEDEMQLILMIWGLPWERMTLGQANMLTVIGYLIQNAVVRANRYLAALEEQRYIQGTDILEEGAFTSLVKAYLQARSKELTECTMIAVDTGGMAQEEASRILKHKVRQSDYLGRLNDGNLYVLLSNTSQEDADFVKKRFVDAGFACEIQEEISI